MDNGSVRMKAAHGCVVIIGGVEGENQKTMMQAECKL